MSAIAGCCWLDGRPASDEDLLVSTVAARHRARCPFRFRSAGSVALAYAADREESCQPFYDPASGITLIVDGCIDNIEDVAGALDVRHRSRAAIVVAAWQRWGLDAGARLLGDFVLVVSDERDHRVVCIRDPMGQRPLFYRCAERVVVFGSELQQIVRHPAFTGDRAYNEAMIAEHLTCEPRTLDETLWRGVARLPPAHALDISEDGANVRRYWDFDRGARLRYTRDDDYAEHFREVFTHSVQCCLSGAETAGVLLSGGIDSSAVAGVGQSLAMAAGCPPLQALTMAFPGRACDETSYSRMVVDAWGLRSTELDFTPPRRDEVARQVARYLDVPAYPNSLAADPVRAHAASAGTELLLTGAGGDDYFAGDPTSHLDHLRKGHVLAWGRAVVSPLLSDGVRNLLRPVLGARRARQPWIRDEFARRVALADRVRPLPSRSFPTKEQEDIHRGATSLVQVLVDEMEDRAAHAAGVLQRHPFYDRRVAEFGLALPSSQRCDGTTTKVVMRRALASYLPADVANRHDKAEFSETFAATIEAIGGRDTFAQLRSEDAGWVDGAVVHRMYESMIELYSRGDDAYIALVGPLWSVAALELWLDGVSASDVD